METESTTLQFAGALPLWLGVAAAIAAGALALFLYRREGGKIGFPAFLRALAIFCIVLILTGPVLRHEEISRTLGRLVVIADASESMDLGDPSMEPGRQAAILRGMDLIETSPLVEAYGQADTVLEEARASLSRLSAIAESAEAKEAGDQTIAIFEKLRDPLARIGGGSTGGLALSKPIDPHVSQLRTVLAGDVRRLTREPGRYLDPIMDGLREVERGISEAVGAGAADSLSGFADLSRFDRLEDVVLDLEKGVIPGLDEAWDVELLGLRDGQLESLWWRRRASGGRGEGEMPDALNLIPDGQSTDLAAALDEASQLVQPGSVVLLLSDGQHNAGPPVGRTAEVFGELGVPVFTVGFGGQTKPTDIAVSEVRAAESVYHSDLATGEIVVEDGLTGGGRQMLSVADRDGNILWSDDFVANGSGFRSFPFSFAVDEVPAVRVGEESGLRNVPLNLTVSVTSIDPAGTKDVEESNNAEPLFMQVLTRKRSVLLIDGRPRWETRYVSHLFERGGAWEIESLLRFGSNGAAGGGADNDLGEFPETADDLFAYDLIILGEVPPGSLEDEEAGWIRDYVTKRGGGLVMIDGRRGWFPSWASTESPLADIFPVTWPGGGGVEMPDQIALTPAGMQLTTFQIEGAGEAWEELPAPKWVARVEPIPTAKILAEVTGGGANGEALSAYAPIGAGTVVYLGTDELWRWRFNGEEKRHEQFWAQLADWTAEPPFSAEGEQVKIGSDKLTYNLGQEIQLRARALDADGRIDVGQDLAAVIYRDGKQVATAPMVIDEAGLTYRGALASLPPGAYEVAIVPDAGRGTPFDTKMTLSVRSPPAKERTALTLDDETLRTVSLASDGQFFYEEDAGGILQTLEDLDQRQVEVTEAAIWSSWWWFLPVIVILTLEWIMRKRRGYI